MIEGVLIFIGVMIAGVAIAIIARERP